MSAAFGSSFEHQRGDFLAFVAQGFVDQQEPVDGLLEYM
jgi:hypothetical protein